MTPRRAWFVGGGVSLCLALALWGALREPDNDRRSPAATTYSSGESGAKALYLLFEQSGLTVERLRSLEWSNADVGRVLWILSPVALPARDAELLVDLVKRGATVVAPPALAADLLVRAGTAAARVEPVKCAAPPCRLGNRWHLRLPEGGPEAQTISGVKPARTYASLDGKPIVASYWVVGGTIVSVGVLDSLRNHTVADDDVGPFWVRVAADLGSRHAFDEMHTGYGDLNVLTLIWRASYRWVAIDLGFVLAVAAWGFGSRERSVRRDPTLRRRETKDHVQAVADWWGRSGDLGLPLTALLVGLDARASARIHATGGRNFIAWAAAMRPELGARAAQVWQEAEQLLARPRSATREVVTVASALRSLEKEVFPC